MEDVSDAGLECTSENTERANSLVEHPLKPVMWFAWLMLATRAPRPVYKLARLISSSAKHVDRLQVRSAYVSHLTLSTQ